MKKSDNVRAFLAVTLAVSAVLAVFAVAGVADLAIPEERTVPLFIVTLAEDGAFLITGKTTSALVVDRETDADRVAAFLLKRGVRTLDAVISPDASRAAEALSKKFGAENNSAPFVSLTSKDESVITLTVSYGGSSVLILTKRSAELSEDELIALSENADFILSDVPLPPTVLRRAALRGNVTFASSDEETVRTAREAGLRCSEVKGNAVIRVDGDSVRLLPDSSVIA